MANEKRLIDADALRKRMFSYYGCVNENSSKEYYRGETLMNYEVADMIEDCIDNAPTVDAVALPCKIGDVVYFHHIEGVKEDGSPIEKVRTGQVYQICIEANNEIWIRVSFGIWYCCRRYTDFYFSREEAEAALAKMDGD